MKTLRLYSFIAGLAGEISVLLVLGYHWRVAWLAVVLIHLVAAALLSWGSAQFLRVDLRDRWEISVIMFAINLPLPGAGTVLVLSALSVPVLPQAKRESGVVVHQNPNPPPVIDSVQQSVFELLHSTRKPERANAILALKDVEPAKAIPLLRRALQDSDELVRIYAQNLLSQIMERVEALTRQLEKELPSERTAAKLAYLAEQYHEQVYIGVVVEKESCRALIEKSTKLLEEAIQQEPQNPRLRLLAVEYLLENSELERASAHLRAAESLPGVTEGMLFPWRAEIDYQLRDWNALHQLMKSHSEITDPALSAIAQFWLEPQKEAAA